MAGRALVPHRAPSFALKRARQQNPNGPHQCSPEQRALRAHPLIMNHASRASREAARHTSGLDTSAVLSVDHLVCRYAAGAGQHSKRHRTCFCPPPSATSGGLPIGRLTRTTRLALSAYATAYCTHPLRLIDDLKSTFLHSLTLVPCQLKSADSRLSSRPVSAASPILGQST